MRLSEKSFVESCMIIVVIRTVIRTVICNLVSRNIYEKKRIPASCLFVQKIIMMQIPPLLLFLFPSQVSLTFCSKVSRISSDNRVSSSFLSHSLVVLSSRVQKPRLVSILVSIF